MATLIGNYEYQWSTVSTYRGILTIELNSQSAINKTSNLTLTFKAYPTDGVFSSNMYWYLNLKFGNVYDTAANNGGSVYSSCGGNYMLGSYRTSSGSYNISNPVTVKTLTVNVPHDSDGKFEGVSLTALGAYGYSGAGSYRSSSLGTITLPQIQVYSEFDISPISNMSLEDTVSVTVYPNDTSWRHEIGISTSSDGTPTALTTLSAGATTTSFTLPSSVANLMTSKSQDLYFTCTPINSSSQRLGTRTTVRRITIPETSEFLPSITNNGTLTPVDSSGTSTASTYMWVSGVTHLNLEGVTVNTEYSGIIQSIYITIDGTRYDLSIDSYTTSGTTRTSTCSLLRSSRPVNTSGQNVTFTITVIDSKGLSTSIQSDPVTIIEYIEPQIITLSARRVNASGNPDTEGSYMQIFYNYSVTPISTSGGTAYNKFYLTIRYKESEQSWSNASYASTIGGQSLNNLESTTNYAPSATLVTAITPTINPNDYNIEFYLRDVMTNNTNYHVAFNLTAMSGVFFNFMSDGSGMAIGKVATESGVLDIGYKLRMYNGYSPKIISTSVSLDDQTTPGFYRGNTSSGIIGVPSGESGEFGLEIYPTGVSTVSQTYRSGTGNEYKRFYNGSTWSNWVNTGDISGALSVMLEALYPVGSIYSSTTNNRPSILPGTWEQIQDKFLMAAGTSHVAGSTGGTTTLSIPNHQHLLPVGYRTGAAYAAINESKYGSVSNQTFSGTSKYWSMSSSTASFSDLKLMKSQSAGSQSLAESDFYPSYIAVYFWKRIS